MSVDDPNQPAQPVAESNLEGPEPADLAAAFPVVGVGASAGGLEALTQLLRALPADTGMGFVIVQHLAPDHVYVIPPARDMFIAGGKLRLLPQERRARHRHRSKTIGAARRRTIHTGGVRSPNF